MNLKGGYKILSLVTLVLIVSVDGTTATDITDANTLEQLDSLKEYLDVSKQLKPILLRVKPSKEKVVMAELSRVDDVTLMIHAKLDGYELDIVVSFEQDEETLLWSIDEAQYLYVKTVNSEVDIKGLIEADKDIISQIKIRYDEDNDVTIAVLPKGVMPLVLDETEAVGEQFYFNYDDNTCIGNLGDVIDGCEIYFRENSGCFEIQFSGEVIPVISHIEYIMYDGDLNYVALNTQKLYYPASAGTKLYKHEIWTTSAVEDLNFYIISTKSTPYTLQDFKDGLIVGVSCICISPERDNDEWLQVPYGLDINTEDKLEIFFSSNVVYTSNNAITDIDDAMVEL